MKKKIIRVIEIIFGYGVLISLFVGGMSALGYIAALIAGGDTAALICDFIYKKMYPVLVYISTGIVVLGLIKMYITGDAAFSSKKKKSGGGR